MNLPHPVVSYLKVIWKAFENFLIRVYMLGEICVLNVMQSESLKLRTVVSTRRFVKLSLFQFVK